jgi:hypothetical protein
MNNDWHNDAMPESTLPQMYGQDEAVTTALAA